MRWLATVAGAGMLLQAGPCMLDANTATVLRDQLVLPQISSVLSDVVFFVLDNALVRLGT
jgi:hypothetical protein